MGSAATDVAKGAFDLSAQQERCERGHRHDSRAQTARQRRERLVGMQEAVTGDRCNLASTTTGLASARREIVMCGS